MPGLKLFNTKGGVTEVTPRLADVEADVQSLVEANMEALLGIRFLASEYSRAIVKSCGLAEMLVCSCVPAA